MPEFIDVNGTDFWPIHHKAQTWAVVVSFVSGVAKGAVKAIAPRRTGQ